MWYRRQDNRLRQFASKFGSSIPLAQFDIRTPYERWAVIFVGDFGRIPGCENLRNIPAAAVFSAPCDTHARHAYWLEGRIGRPTQGDWQFGYTRMVTNGKP